MRTTVYYRVEILHENLVIALKNCERKKYKLNNELYCLFFLKYEQSTDHDLSNR